jgi:hypothetical protein
VLADVLRTDWRRLQPLTQDQSETLGLRMLIRTRHDLVTARVAAHNQLRAHLLSTFPGAVGLFHRLDGGISLTFLTRFPTPRPLVVRNPACHMAFGREVHAGQDPDTGPVDDPPTDVTAGPARRAGR